MTLFKEKKKKRPKMDTFEKVYVTRDEDSDIIFIWRKPDKGLWQPEQLKGCEVVNFQRKDGNLDNVSCYRVEDFKKKFNFIINEKTIRNKKISTKLLNNDDYQLFSDNPKRKR